jgi:transcriptional regulator with XRE-family HTH domain
VKSRNERKQVVFGQTIRGLRQKGELTLAELARLARIHPSYLADVERGERNLSLLNILKLADALRVHPAKLFLKF